jgi:hypothetical protein
MDNGDIVTNVDSLLTKSVQSRHSKVLFERNYFSDDFHKWSVEIRLDPVNHEQE